MKKKEESITKVEIAKSLRKIYAEGPGDRWHNGSKSKGFKIALELIAKELQLEGY